MCLLYLYCKDLTQQTCGNQTTTDVNFQMTYEPHLSACILADLSHQLPQCHLTDCPISNSNSDWLLMATDLPLTHLSSPHSAFQQYFKVITDHLAHSLPTTRYNYYSKFWSKKPTVGYLVLYDLTCHCCGTIQIFVMIASSTSMVNKTSQTNILDTSYLILATNMLSSLFLLYILAH